MNRPSMLRNPGRAARQTLSRHVDRLSQGFQLSTGVELAHIALGFNTPLLNSPVKYEHETPPVMGLTGLGDVHTRTTNQNPGSAVPCDPVHGARNRVGASAGWRDRLRRFGVRA